MNNKQLTLYVTTRETALGVGYLAFELLILPVLIQLVCMGLGIYSGTVVNLIYYVINAVCCGWIFRRLLGQSLENARRNTKDLINAVVLGFLGYYIASLVLGLLITVLKPDFANVNDGVVLGMIDEQPLLMTFAVVVLAPIAEECLFRGLIFVPLARKNVYLGYAVTCLSFAAIHVVGYIGSYDATTLAICFLQYLAPGAALCWACKKADSLCAPMLIHAVINALSVLVLR